ncbi:MAG: hypothetical protein A2017_21600 [Lentisphaerae bacterium GWF2_44_16]|nr:MAG: hypothetical protein A2017_21600 [Lentisphaerae bacterium GWF2_44_16]
MHDKKGSFFFLAFLNGLQRRIIYLFTGTIPGEDNKKELPEKQGNAEKKEGENTVDAKKDLAHKKEKKEETKIVDTDYWWCFEGYPATELPVFEILSDDRVAEELRRKLEADEFPVIEIPENVMRTMQILNKHEFDYNEVIDLVRRSPAMVGEFIKVINSSLYSRGVVINDLRVALPRLGKENIKALLYMYSSKMTFSTDMLFNDLAVDIVEHCYATALISSYLAQIYYPDPDGAFLAGLMHDIGKLGILKALTDTYEFPTHVDFEMTEDLFDKVFPELHERAGSYLATHWKVNETIISAIQHHHDFNDYDFTLDGELARQLSALINLSDIMARIMGKGRRIDAVNIFDTPAAKMLGFEKDHETVKFLENIPEIVYLKSAEREQNAKKK